MADQGQARVLDTCHKLELTMAKLYYLLARQHAELAPVQALWVKTAREEDNHAQQFALLLRRGRTRPPARVDAEKAKAALAALEAVLTAFEAKAPSVHEALESAVMLERALAQFHADYAVAFANEDERKLFRSMMAADEDHVVALEAMLTRDAAR